MINTQETSQITKIYLVENCYGDPNKVYIGKTTTSRKSPHKRKYGEDIIYTEIDEVFSLNYNDWEPLESFWIEYFRQLGFDLQNKRMKGGSGPEFMPLESNLKRINSKYKNVLQYDLEGNLINKWKGIKNASMSIGLKNNSDITSCCKKKIKTSYGFIWRYEDDPLNNYYKHEINRHSVSVLQYDLEGNFIQEWESITKASINTNSPPSTINKCCNGTLKSSGGFQWRYKIPNYELFISPKKKTSHTYKPINQFDLNGLFIKSWDNIEEASKFLGKKSGGDISKCCNNKSKTAYGYIWKFK